MEMDMEVKKEIDPELLNELQPMIESIKEKCRDYDCDPMEALEAAMSGEAEEEEDAEELPSSEQESEEAPAPKGNKMLVIAAMKKKKGLM